MGFRALRVLNDDRVRPGKGFGTHGHRDMEILSYVLEGALEHKDSSGGGGVIRPGEIQFMRAGSGVEHSEYNHSQTEPVHFLQVWIVPDRRGLAPKYGQQAFDREGAKRSLVLLASRDGRQGSLQVAQDVDVWMTQLAGGERRELPLAPGRQAWIHLARGAASVNGTSLREGDGAGASNEESLKFLVCVWPNSRNKIDSHVSCRAKWMNVDIQSPRQYDRGKQRRSLGDEGCVLRLGHRSPP